MPLQLVRVFAAIACAAFLLSPSLSPAAQVGVPVSARMLSLSTASGFSDHVLDSIINPAFESAETIQVGLSFSGRLEDYGNVFKAVSDISEYDTSLDSDLFNDPVAYDQFITDLQGISGDVDSVFGDGAGQVAVAYKNFRFSYATYGALTLDPAVDLENVSQDVFASDSLLFNGTNVSLQATLTDRFSFGYARPVLDFDTGLGESKLIVGASASMFVMRNYAIRKSVYDPFFEEFSVEDLLDEFVERNKEDNTQFDLDLAGRVVLGEFLEAGLIFQNILGAESEFVDGFDAAEMELGTRLFVVGRVPGVVTASLDVDLVERQVFAAKANSQRLNFGVELEVIPVLRLRGGIQTDFGTEITAYSGGLGLDFKYVELNLGVALAGNTSIDFGEVSENEIGKIQGGVDLRVQI